MPATTRPTDVPVSRPSFSVRRPDPVVVKVGDAVRATSAVDRPSLVEPDNDDRVARAGITQHRVQARARPLGGVGQLVGEHPARVDTRSVQRRELTLKVPLDGAGCGVAQRAGHELKV